LRKTGGSLESHEGDEEEEGNMKKPGTVTMHVRADRTGPHSGSASIPMRKIAC
jgi:hypothetical protein